MQGRFTSINMSDEKKLRRQCHKKAFKILLRYSFFNLLFPGLETLEIN